MKIIEKEFNVQTGETTITEREMNVEELAQREADNATAQAEAEAKAAKESERQAVLDRLGLTVEEAALLLGGN